MRIFQEIKQRKMTEKRIEDEFGSLYPRKYCKC